MDVHEVLAGTGLDRAPVLLDGRDDLGKLAGHGGLELAVGTLEVEPRRHTNEFEPESKTSTSPSAVIRTSYPW